MANRPTPATGRIQPKSSTCCKCGKRLDISGKRISDLQGELYCPACGKAYNVNPGRILPPLLGGKQ